MSSGGGGTKSGFVEPVSYVSEFRKGNYSISGKQDPSISSSQKMLSKRDSISGD